MSTADLCQTMCVGISWVAVGEGGGGRWTKRILKKGNKSSSSEAHTNDFYYMGWKNNLHMKAPEFDTMTQMIGLLQNMRQVKKKKLWRLIFKKTFISSEYLYSNSMIKCPSGFFIPSLMYLIYPMSLLHLLSFDLLPSWDSGFQGIKTHSMCLEKNKKYMCEGCEWVEIL